MVYSKLLLSLKCIIMKKKVALYSTEVVLGGYYNIYYNGFLIHQHVKLIQVTNKGYNFLNEKENKVIITNTHYYQNTYHRNVDGIIFSITHMPWLRFKPSNLDTDGWFKPSTNMENGYYWFRSPYLHRYFGVDTFFGYYSQYKQEIYSKYNPCVNKTFNILELTAVKKIK